MENSPTPLNDNIIFDLKLKINVVKAEIEKVKLELNEFEAILRNFVLDDMIEEQELAAKYRNFQKSKKLKRQEQKRKGKNYKEPIGLIKEQAVSTSRESEESKNERKKMYRDAMMLIHPDRVGGSNEEKEKATVLTAKLVDIYHNGNFNELELFCGYLQRESHITILDSTQMSGEENPTAIYFESELVKYEKTLQDLKAKHTYKVLSTYTRPVDFAQELKDYYKDRIEKLKRRTRKVK